MPKAIIGITGTLGSGKGEIVNFLKGIGWPCITLSDIIRDGLKENHIDDTRDNMISFGNKLRKELGEDILAKTAKEKAEAAGWEVYAIDGIRNPAEAEYLKKQDNFYLIGVDAPAELRYKRAIERGKETDPKALADIKALDERDLAIGIEECLKKANILITNDKSIDVLFKQFDDFICDKQIKFINRLSKDEYYIDNARGFARRATCIRRAYGAIIVNNDRVVSTGYCGAPRGTPNCSSLGKCFRRMMGIPSGQNYDACISVHAEENAIIHASFEEMQGGTIYIAGIDREKPNEQPAYAHPCNRCKKMILNSGVAKVVYHDRAGKINTIMVDDWRKELWQNPYRDIEKLVKK